MKNTFATRRELSIAFVLFYVVVAVVRWDSTSLPYFWDELDFYIAYAYTLFENNFGLTLKWTDMVSFHTPLYFIFIAALTKILGWKVIVVRMTVFGAAAGYLTAAFALLRLKANAFVSSLFIAALICSPLFLSEAALAQPDLPMGALALWSLYFLIHPEQPKWFFKSSIIYCLAVLTNATFIGLGLVYAGIIFFKERALPLTARLKSTIVYFLPAAIFLLIWLIYYHKVQGVWFTGIPDPDNVDSYYKRGIWLVIKRIFAHRPLQMLLWDGRWPLALSVIGFYFLKRKRKDRNDLAHFALIAMVAMHIIFLSIVGTGHQRYFLASFPCLYILSGWLFSEAKKPVWQPAALAMFSAALAVYAWFGEPDKYSGFEYRASYRDQVKLIQKVAGDLEKEKNTAQIYTHWPFHRALLQPFTGYVSAPIATKMLEPGLLQNSGFDRNGKLLTISYSGIPDLTNEYLAVKYKTPHFTGSCRTWEEGKWRAELCQSQSN